MSINLLHGDCIEEMAKMDAGSIDLTVTSPPYDNLRTYEGSLEWSEEIWKQVLEQLYRVTKQGGVVVWIVGDATIKGSETGTSFKQALYAKEIGFNLHDTMIYEKSTSPFPMHTRCNQLFEYMFVFAKKAPSCFNPIKIPTKTGGQRRKKDGGYRAADGSMKSANYATRKTTKTIGNIWRYCVGGKSTPHPASFPLQLASDHIRSWSNEGDTVLDPFMGSGTTGIACKNLNRNFIGIEKVGKYFEIAKARVCS